MTSRHQDEHKFTFTSTEIGYLLTTQWLAEEKDKTWVFDPNKPENMYQATLGDMMKFGWTLQDAVADGKTSIPIKI